MLIMQGEKKFIMVHKLATAVDHKLYTNISSKSSENIKMDTLISNRRVLQTQLVPPEGSATL